MECTISLEHCGERTAEVGGKAAGLSRLIGYGFQVPAGFVVTTDAYRAAVQAAALDAEIAEQLKGPRRRSGSTRTNASAPTPHVVAAT
jgi:rifampicin phosphotransferase